MNGIWNVTRSAYFEDDDLSSVASTPLRVLLESRLEYFGRHIAKLIPPKETTRPQLVGNAVHTAYLEPDRFPVDYAIEPNVGNRARKLGKDAIAAWRKANALPGRTILSHDEGLVVTGCTLGLMHDRDASAIAKLPGRAEVAIRWLDEESGVWCKALLDRPLPELDLVVDLKTIAGHPTPAAVSAAIAEWRLDVQAAHHLAGSQVIYGKPLTWLWIFVGKELPHIVTTRYIGERTLAVGQATRRRLLADLAACRASGDWSEKWNRRDEVMAADLPEWFLRREEHA